MVRAALDGQNHAVVNLVSAGGLSSHRRDPLSFGLIDKAQRPPDLGVIGRGARGSGSHFEINSLAIEEAVSIGSPMPGTKTPSLSGLINHMCVDLFPR